jgi:hypothetical protein
LSGFSFSFATISAGIRCRTTSAIHIRDSIDVTIRIMAAAGVMVADAMVTDVMQVVDATVMDVTVVTRAGGARGNGRDGREGEGREPGGRLNGRDIDWRGVTRVPRRTFGNEPGHPVDEPVARRVIDSEPEVENLPRRVGSAGSVPSADGEESTGWSWTASASGVLERPTGARDATHGPLDEIRRSRIYRTESRAPRNQLKLRKHRRRRQ